MPQYKVQPVSNNCFPYVQPPVEIQVEQAQGAEQTAHGTLGARDTALQGLQKPVLEGVVPREKFNPLQVNNWTSDPRHGLASGATSGARVGAQVEGPPAGAKAGVVTGGPIGGAELPRVCAAAEVRGTESNSTVLRKDDKGRPLAACGCLLRSEPPPVPEELLSSCWSLMWSCSGSSMPRRHLTTAPTKLCQ